jgi:hypothetical protein
MDALNMIDNFSGAEAQLLLLTEGQLWRHVGAIVTFLLSFIKLVLLIRISWLR